MANTTIQSRPLTNFYRRDLPDTCVSFLSKEGREIFAEALASGHMETYFSLAAQFRTQDEPTFCGLATLVMALNALEVDPKRIWKGPWRWYHENMLDCCSPLENVKKNGITLDQFSCLAACNMLDVDTKRATEHATEAAFRDTVKKVTRFTHEVLALSYSRRILGQTETGDGHFSPLAGYHPTKDLVLILDTARFKYPPHWVPLSLLWKAMQQYDKDTGLPRGYSVLSRKDTKPLLVFRLSDLLNIPLQESDSALIGIHQFVESWNSWLTTESQDLGKDDFFIEVLRGLCKSMEKLNPKKAILSTQVDCRGENGNLEEHMNRAKEIVKSLESFDIFERIKLSLARDAVLFQMCKLVCKTSEQSSADKCFTQICCDTVCNVTDKLGLEPAHFITLLLLAWPYDIHVLPSNANGYILQSFMSDAIASQTDAIKNETEHVGDQLRGVLMYIKDHINLTI